MKYALVTRNAIANRIGTTPHTINRMIASGVIPGPVRISIGRTKLFHWPTVAERLEGVGIPTAGLDWPAVRESKG